MSDPAGPAPTAAHAPALASAVSVGAGMFLPECGGCANVNCARAWSWSAATCARPASKRSTKASKAGAWSAPRIPSNSSLLRPSVILRATAKKASCVSLFFCARVDSCSKTTPVCSMSRENFKSAPSAWTREVSAALSSVVLEKSCKILNSASTVKE